MAKSGRKPAGDGESVSGYFRNVFEERPELLEAHSNDELFLRWLKDHPGEKEVPKRIKASLFNIKSVLRSKQRRKPASPSLGSTSSSMQLRSGSQVSSRNTLSFQTPSRSRSAPPRHY